MSVPCRSHCSAALLQRATCPTLAACHLYDAAGCHVYDAAAVGEKASCLLPAATKLYVRDFSYRAHRLQARVLDSCPILCVLRVLWRIEAGL